MLIEGLTKFARGSPGESFIMMKERIVIPIMTGIESNSLFAIYLTMDTS
jgi:hypothetical protein